jgi:hypothetical protein
MTSMTWTDAPAGYLGLGSSDARPQADLRLRTAQGTALPFAWDRQVLVPAGGERLVQDFRVRTCIAPTDGTTLGIHVPGRPPS